MLKRWVFSAECAWTRGPRDMTRAQIKLGSGRRGRRPAASRSCLTPPPRPPRQRYTPATFYHPTTLINVLRTFATCLILIFINKSLSCRYLMFLENNVTVLRHSDYAKISFYYSTRFNYLFIMQLIACTAVIT